MQFSCKFRVPEVPVTFAGYLSELQEHASLSDGGHAMAKRTAEKYVFPVIVLKNGLERSLNASLFSFESAKSMKLKKLSGLEL